MEKLKYMLFIRITMLVLDVFIFGMGIYSLMNSALNDKPVFIGIILMAISFYGFIITIFLVVRAVIYNMIGKVIVEKNLNNPSKIAKELRFNEDMVKNYVTVISNKQLINGFYYTANDNRHEKHCLVCPSCGAHLLANDSQYCEFCGKKL